MAQIPNLENAPINLLSLREQSQKELLAILRNIRGKKLLVIDQKLSGSLALIIQTSVLKENGVENLRHLSEDPIQTECKHIVYLVRSQIDLMRLVSSNIQSDNRQGLQREYHLFFVPRRTIACEKILQEEKVHQCLNIGEFPLYMIPLEEDVLSFELDMSLKENLVDGDSSSLWHVANGIHKLEASFGAIPYIRWKGKAAAKVKDILEHMQIEQPVTSADLGTPEINTLILLDREVDMVTPMCTQLTYEGLLDELLQVTNGAVELDASIMSVQQSAKKVKVPLNSNDKLYKEVRDLNFEVVVQVLRQKATSMKQDYTEVTTTSQTVAELKDFVKKLNSLPEMTRHINLAQHLTTFTTKPSFLSQLDIEHTLVEGQGYEICADYIEEMIHKQEPVLNVLRLLVLYSLSSSGLPKKQFDYFRREILHSYGFEHMSTLNNLERAGLFKKQDIKSNWLTIKRALQLVPDETDTRNPNDISYVFSGYAPLSVRLVQHAIKYGWRAMEETLKLLPGPHDEIKRDFYSNVPSFDSRQGAPQDKLTDGRRSVVLVVFIGGITFAEIAALRFLSSQEGMAYEVIIGTTKVINGNKLLDGFIDIHVEGPKKINGKT